MAIYDAFYNTVSRLLRVKPKNLVLLVTEKCNARCIMCNIWKDGISSQEQLEPENYKAILKKPFFSRISSVMLSGGEALLRNDIFSIVDVLLNTLPRLRTIGIATNGLSTSSIKNKVEQIAQIIQAFNEKGKHKLNLVVQISFDGVSSVHDVIRGPNAHERVTETIEHLIRLRKRFCMLNLNAGCVIQPLNLSEVEQMYEYLMSKNISPIFTVVCQGEYYYKNDKQELINFSHEQIEVLKKTLMMLKLREQDLGKKLLYNEFYNMLNGKPSRRGCPAIWDTITIEPSGKVIPCLNSGESALGNITRDSLDDVWFSRSTKDLVSAIKKQKCPSCMFACGVSYVELLRFAILASWKKE